MKIIQKTLILEKKEYYEKHLELINPLIPAPLVNMEIKVLALFMSLEGDLVEENRFNTQARKFVCKELNISNSGLSNYLGTLESKGSILKNLAGNFEIVNLMKAENELQFYQFKLQKK